MKTRTEIIWDDRQDATGWYLRHRDSDGIEHDSCRHMPTGQDASDTELLEAAELEADWAGLALPPADEIKIIRPDSK